MGLNKPFMWKNHWKQVGWAWRLCVAGPQRITRVGQTVWARLMGSLTWNLPAGTVALSGEGSEKEQCPLLALPVGRKLSSSSRPDARQFNFSPVDSDALHLLPLHWSSEGVSVRMCVGPLRGTVWDSSSFCLPQLQSPLVFTARSYGDLSSWHWKPGLVGLM